MLLEDVQMYTDLILQKTLHKMSIDQEVSIRTKKITLKKELLSRKSINKHMINNVRLHDLKTKNDLDDSNVEIEPCHSDPKFVTEYNEKVDNFSVGK